MALDQDLLSLEKRHWTEGGGQVEDECLVALTEKGFLRIDDETAMLTYEVIASRKDGSQHRSLCSAGYVKRDGEWTMMFQQQTPLDGKAN